VPHASGLDLADETTVPPPLTMTVAPLSAPILPSVATTIQCGIPSKFSSTGLGQDTALDLGSELLRRRLFAVLAFANGNEVREIFSRSEDIVARIEKLGSGALSGLGDARVKSDDGQISSGGDTPVAKTDLSTGEKCVEEFMQLNGLPIAAADTRARLQRALSENRALISSSEKEHRAFARAGGCQRLADLVPKCPRMYASLWEELFASILSVCRYDDSSPVITRNVTVFVLCRQGIEFAFVYD